MFWPLYPIQRQIGVVFMNQLLIIEDDTQLRDNISDYFTLKGYSVTATDSGAGFHTRFAHGSYDLILLDLNLPDTDGQFLLKEIRETSDTPVFVVSGRTDEHNRLLALEGMADDYISKPFNIRELELRIRNFLSREQRRRIASSKERWRVGALVLDVGQHLIIDTEGQTTPLTAGECALMVCLLSAAGELISREKLLACLRKQGQAVSTDSLPVLISRLRQKFRDAAPEAVIHTVTGVGYRVLADTERIQP